MFHISKSKCFHWLMPPRIHPGLFSGKLSKSLAQRLHFTMLVS